VKTFLILEFYKSEQLSGSVNFSWNAFNLTYLPSYYTSSSQVCIRVWVTEATSDPKVHLEYEIDLKLLHILEPSTNLVSRDIYCIFKVFYQLQSSIEFTLHIIKLFL